MTFNATNEEEGKWCKWIVRSAFIPTYLRYLKMREEEEIALKLYHTKTMALTKLWQTNGEKRILKKTTDLKKNQKKIYYIEMKSKII